MPVPTPQVIQLPNQIGTGGAALTGIQALAAAIQKAGADAKAKADQEAKDKAAAAAGQPGGLPGAGAPQVASYTPVQPNPFEAPPNMSQASPDQLAILQALLAKR